MKISEVIKELQARIDLYGDLEVCTEKIYGDARDRVIAVTYDNERGKIVICNDHSNISSMEILQRIFNHSSIDTFRYIGIEKDTVKNPVASSGRSDLRALISVAYDLGVVNAGEMDSSVHVDAKTDLLEIANKLISNLV